MKTCAVRFELLVVPHCPYEAAAADLFRSSLATAGLPTQISSVVVSDPATAERSSFSGSPSFFADGLDLLPDNQEPGIACRLYATGRGLSGLPDEQSLVDALRAAAATGH